jgi:hypothetical protein
LISTTLRASLCAGTLACVASTFAVAKTFDNAELRYSVDLPDACRHEEGPGTLEAVCAPDMDSAKSYEIAAAASFLLEVDGEALPAEAKPYTVAEFRQELPEGVCGEGDTNKVSLTDVTESKNGEQTTFRAIVNCPEIKFLALPPRIAEVRFVTASGFRYRLMARVPADAAESTKATTAAFFASFKTK